MSAINYGPFHEIVKVYPLFVYHCIRQPLRDRPRYFTGPLPEWFHSTKMLVIEFNIRPQRRMFEENVLHKFKTQPDWYAISERVARQIIRKLFPPFIYATHKYEVVQHDLGMLATVVIPMPNTGYAGWRQLGKALKETAENYFTLADTPWTKKMKKWETETDNIIPVTVANPIDGKRVAMVAEDFALTNGYVPYWVVHQWHDLAEAFQLHGEVDPFC